MATTDLFQNALFEFDRRARVVGPGQWKDPTPCRDWDVHQLANHVVGEVRWIPPLLEGRTMEEVGDRLDGDLLGADPQRSWEEASRDATAAATQPGVTDRTVHLSFGDVAGGEYLAQVTADVAVHTWDLARAIGSDERLEPGLVAFVHDYLAPRAEEWRAAGAFGEAVEAPADADLQTRLLALLGRRA
jgi:uncharacterized protein (TIGR03086 family)